MVKVSTLAASQLPPLQLQYHLLPLCSGPTTTPHPTPWLRPEAGISGMDTNCTRLLLTGLNKRPDHMCLFF